MIYFNRKSAAKYFFVRDYCNTITISDSKKNEFIECSLLGVSDPKIYNYIVDLYIPKQECSSVETDIDQTDRMSFYNSIEERGLEDACRQTWFHTHPGTSANPSTCDKNTWKDVYLKTEFGFGGMGIIAKNKGKDCIFSQIIYDSVIGQQSGECEMVFEAYPEKWVSFEYIYDIEESNELYGCGDIHNTLFIDFAEFHEEWLEEIKTKVKEKSKHFMSYGGDFVRSYYGNNYSESYKSTYKENDKSKKIGKQHNEEPKSREKVLDKLIDLYCTFNKNSFNEFSKKEQKIILDKLNIKQSDIEDVQRLLKQNEKAYSYSDVAQWGCEIEDNDFKYNDFIDMKTMTNLAKSFKSSDLYKVCRENIIRPCRLIELVDDYILHLKGEND